MKTNKIISLIIVSLMLLSGLSLMAGISRADIINKDGSDILISATNLDDDMHYRSENITFYVTMRNDGPSSLEHCNLTINTQVHDEEGNNVESPFIWHVQDVNDDATLGTVFPSNRHTFSGFAARIKADVEYGTYNVTVHLSYKDSSGNPGSYEGWILFYIGPRAGMGIYSGDSTYPGEIDHNLYMYIYSEETVHNVYWNISSEDRDFDFSVDSLYRDDLYSYSTWRGHFFFNVTKDKAPGYYEFTWTLQYTYNGIWTEDSGTINIYVMPLGTIEMSCDVAEIPRGTSTMNMTFSFTNTGNVDLQNLDIKLDPASTAYFTIPQEVDHFEGSTPIYVDQWVHVGDVAQGETVQKTIKMIIDSHLPAGEHKVLFDFRADSPNGSFHEDWTWDSYPSDGSSAHYIPGWNGYYMLESESLHHGAFVMFDVTGDVFDMEITPAYGITTSTVSIISEDNFLDLRVENNEARVYRDVSFYVYTGTGSPFMNPDDSASDWSEPYNVTRINGHSTAYVSIHVVVRPGTTAGYYDVPILIKATDLTASNNVEVQTETRVLIVGSGAKPVITDISYDQIKAGETFKVRLTVTNEGDDVAKSLQVMLAVSPEQNNIALINGAPQVETLAPGESVTLEYTFIASPHIDASHAYPITATMNYDNKYLGNSESATQQVGVSAESGSINMSDILSMLLIVLVIIAIIGGALYLVRSVKKEKPPAQPEPVAQPQPEPVQAPEPVEETVAEEPETGEEGL